MAKSGHKREAPALPSGRLGRDGKDLHPGQAGGLIYHHLWDKVWQAANDRSIDTWANGFGKMWIFLGRESCPGCQMEGRIHIQDDLSEGKNLGIIERMATNNLIPWNHRTYSIMTGRFKRWNCYTILPILSSGMQSMVSWVVSKLSLVTLWDIRRSDSRKIKGFPDAPVSNVTRQILFLSCISSP